MRAGLRPLLVIGVALIGTAAFAQQNPDTERGARPGLAYRLEGLDTVNMFNGTFNVALPLGAAYPVGGTLSYSLTAHYATNAWESMTHEEDIEGDPVGSRTYTYWYPSEHANAGFGWIVSLGRLDVTPHPEDFADQHSYVAPDGNKHGFKPTLHIGNPAEQSETNVEYTRDGSYLRLTKEANGSFRMEFPNGQIHKFNTAGLLTRMEDRFGNSVDVSYKSRQQVNGPTDQYPNSTVWEITDSVGRVQRVFFRPGWDYFEELQIGDPVPAVKSHEMVDYVELMAFDGQTAVYSFSYDAEPVPITPANQNDLSLRMSRRCSTGVQDPEAPRFVRVSLLKSLAMPHGVTYAMVTDRGDRTNCSTTLLGGISGNLTKLTLPTGGTIEWAYQVYSFPTISRPSHNAGIATRTIRLSDGGTAVAVATYERGTVSSEIGADVYRMVTNRSGDNAVLYATKHYFAACPNSNWCGSSADYGLPYRRTNNLSTEMLLPDESAALVSKRKTYVRYEADTLFASGGLEWENKNQRPAYQKTEYEDGKYEEITYSGFDGLGHYRKAVTNGNFESGNVRTAFTNYNANAGTYELNTDGTLKYAYSMLASASPWLLTTFDKQWTAEPNAQGQDVYSRTSVCFDANGFMTSRRTYKALSSTSDFTNDTKDLLAVFTPDSDGNVQREQYFGGDETSAPTQNCNSSYSGEAYRIDHAYAFGVEESSYYVQNGSPLSFYLTDNVIDSTGLVSSIRRYRGYGLADGLSTSFTYDLLGRLKTTAGTRLETSYTYALQPPKITVTDKQLTPSSSLRTSTMEFDTFGRLTKERRSMPSNATATRTAEYNGLGWKTAVTDWGASQPTRFTYDGFGRPISIQTPDQTTADAASIAYTGIAQVERTTKVRTGGTGTDLILSAATTTEDYDRQGRLIRVTEPPPVPDGTRPETRYSYDVGGRLTKVCANVNANGACGQTRTFTYDNRGFLTTETHPENATTTYVSYDARGHLRRRYSGAPYQFDVELSYDAAERLKQVDERLSQSNTRPLKIFSYATANAGTDLKNGRLVEAVRHNWVSVPAATPIPYNVQVIEKYTYTDVEGNVSARETEDYPCPVSTGQDCKSLRPVTVNHRFQQEFQYSPLDAPATLSYPVCLLGGCTSIAARTVTNAYSNGLLTSVSSADTASASLTYHESGLVNTIVHGNGVTDTQSVDPLTPGRPQEIVTTGAIAAGACIAPSFSEPPQSQTITGGTSITLHALASGQAGSNITYQWYQGTAPDTSTPLGTGTSLTVSPGVTRSYWVKATNTCASTNSVTAVVTVCAEPSIPDELPDRTITRGQTKTLQITPAGSEPLTVQWFTVASNGAETAIPGATSASLTISPTHTTTYLVRVSNECASATDISTVTVVDPPTTPTAVTAVYNTATGKNEISWTGSSSEVDIASYWVIRQPDNQAFFVAYPTTSYVDQNGLIAGKAYVYRVTAVDDNGVSSLNSDPDIASVRTFTTEPLAAGGLITIQAIHVSELRAAVDAVRSAVGLPAAWTSYAAPVGVAVSAADFTQLRDRLNEARVAVGLSPVTFSLPVAPGQSIIAAAVVTLRNGVK